MNGCPCWRVAGASVTGASHEKTGAPCQDAHGWALVDGGMIVAAVADGAGTSRLAEAGARTAVYAAVTGLAASLRDSGSPVDGPGWREALAGAVRQALERVLAEAESLGAVPRDLACTLAVAVATRDFVAALQIGDGAVVAGSGQDGGFVTVTKPVSGEYINETTFLVSPGALDTAEFAFQGGGCRRVALLTDGLQRLALRMPQAAPVPGFFTPLFDFVETGSEAELTARLDQLLRSARVRERTDDDCTLVLASWNELPVPE